MGPTTGGKAESSVGCDESGVSASGTETLGIQETREMKAIDRSCRCSTQTSPDTQCAYLIRLARQRRWKNLPAPCYGHPTGMVKRL
jgi:hypothetical protein